MKKLPHYQTKLICVCLIFLLTCAWASYSLLHNRQDLDWKRGEFSHMIAYNLYATGSMYEEAPFVARPPGYIFFLAGLYAMADAPMPDDFAQATPEGQRRITGRLLMFFYLAQVIVFSFSAVILFLWCGRLMDERSALVMSLCYGGNVYMIFMTGLLHYGILHLFFTLLSGFYLTEVLKTPFNRVKVLWTGILWGITTLIRPLTLILPIFIFLASCIVFSKRKKDIVVFNLLFILGMAMVIGPYTVRNYRLTKRFIPINAQAGVALWAATEPHPNINANEYFWPQLLPKFDKIFRETTKEATYSYDGFIIHNLMLEEAFKKEAIHNFYQNPGIYFHNVLTNLVNFALTTDSVAIKTFEDRQINGYQKAAPLDRQDPRPPPFRHTTTTRIFELLCWLLTGLGLAGVFSALKSKDLRLLIPALIIGCYWIGHSIIYLDNKYYYFKQPFLFIFAGYILAQMNGSTSGRWPWSGPVVFRLLIGLIILATIILNTAVIL